MVRFFGGAATDMKLSPGVYANTWRCVKRWRRTKSVTEVILLILMVKGERLRSLDLHSGRSCFDINFT